MEAHYFTCGQLLDVLAEIETIKDNKLFVKHIFSIIHHEVITVSYLNAPHQSNDDAHLGDNLLLVGLEQAKRDAKNKLLTYCYLLKGTNEVALPLLQKAQETKACIENLKAQSKNTPFWQLKLLISLWKTKKGMLQEHIPFTDVGNLFLYLYIKRGIGDAMTFRYDLMRFSRHVSKAPEEKKNGKLRFKNPFSGSSIMGSINSLL